MPIPFAWAAVHRLVQPPTPEPLILNLTSGAKEGEFAIAKSQDKIKFVSFRFVFVFVFVHVFLVLFASATASIGARVPRLYRAVLRCAVRVVGQESRLGVWGRGNGGARCRGAWGGLRERGGVLGLDVNLEVYREVPLVSRVFVCSSGCVGGRLGGWTRIAD